ncbi:SPOSA6832_02900 [Sporobolomyces salmonicolor]|uniref:SPOSA6832_02900-mRNA-1:cds n=1 Tax=Sporidiobolus salmonicolor TaxID=5005 RepID=A0A0D6EML3_SPOSA|nr:SPOSA6832_02900 [Sporobolomyces salmonicolor]
MAALANYHRVESPEDLQAQLSTDLNRVSVLYFRADWAEPCKTMDGVTTELAKRWDAVLFLSIEAEALPDISESFEVDAVPYFILLRVGPSPSLLPISPSKPPLLTPARLVNQGHTLLTRLSGAQPSVLSAALKSHASKPSALSSSSQAPVAAKTIYQPSEQATGSAGAGGTVGAGGEGEDEFEESDEELTKRSEALMRQSDVVLFMKGDRDTPRCGFSQKIVGILNSEGIDYTTYDILADEGVRQKLKELNEWPTFPQLIVKGEFCGGLDVVKEMAEAGELQEMIKG